MMGPNEGNSCTVPDAGSECTCKRHRLRAQWRQAYRWNAYRGKRRTVLHGNGWVRRDDRRHARYGDAEGHVYLHLGRTEAGAEECHHRRRLFRKLDWEPWGHLQQWSRPPGDPDASAPAGLTDRGTASGKKAFLKQVVDGGFKYEIEPSASSNGTATVWVSVTVYDVEVSVAGSVQPSSGSARTIIGRKQTATISDGGLGATFHVYSWSASGVPVFEKVVTGTQVSNPEFPNEYGFQSRGYDTTLTSTEESFPFYAYEDGVETVTCTATISFSVGGESYQFPVVGEKKVVVVAPTFDLTIIPGSSTVITPGGQQQATDFELNPATEFEFWANTPPTDATLLGGPGQFAICQLISVKVTAFRQGAAPLVVLNSDGMALDNTFPYKEAKITPATKSAATATTDDDAPGFGLQSSGAAITGVEVDYKFVTTNMFNPGGADSVWVPLKSQDWKWFATITTDSNLVWPATGPGAELTSDAREFDLGALTWTKLYMN